MTALEIYSKAADIATDKIAEEKRKQGIFFEIPDASPKQEAEALESLGYTVNDLLKMEHDKVLAEVLRQLKNRANEWEPINYDWLSK